MTVNTNRPQAAAPTVAVSRLYLRDEELLAGLAALMDATAALKAASEPRRREFDLSWADLRALLAAAQGDQTIMDLAARLSVTKQALTKTIDGLEARRLVVRERDRRDGRRRLVRPTGAGEALLRDATQAMRARLGEAYRAVGGEAVAGSDQVLAAITRSPAPGAPR